MAAVGFGGLAPAYPAVDGAVPVLLAGLFLNVYPEMHFLADPKLVGAASSKGPTISMMLFDNNQYPRFDQAMRAVCYFHLITISNYERFVMDQVHNRLTQQSFLTLKEKAERLMYNLRIEAQAIHAALILKNISAVKAPHWRQYLEHLTANPQESPTFAGLNEIERTVITAAAGLAQFDRLFNHEMAPHLFLPLAEIDGLNREIVELALFIECCDAMGKGHFTQETFDRYQEIEWACIAAMKH